MFPFASGAPLASRNNSPAVSGSVAQQPATQPTSTLSRTPSRRGRTQSCSSHCSNNSYTHKKAHWRCKLRQVHPFIANEPQSWCTHEASEDVKVQPTETPKQKRSKKRRCTYLPHVLLFAAVLLSIAVLAMGLVYATNVSKPPVLPQAAPFTAPGRVPASTNATTFPTTGGTVTKRQGRAIANGTNTNTVSQLEFEEARKRYGSVIGLFFYVAALPIVTILHVFAEVVVAFVLARLARHQPQATRSPSIHDDDESFCDSDTETLAGEEKFKHELAFPNPPIEPATQPTVKDADIDTRLGKAKRYIAIMSIVSSYLILSGWIVVSTIQTHCELLNFGDKSICPPQTQFSANTPKDASIVPLSVSRTSASWLIALLYLAQIVICLRQHKFISFGFLKSANKSGSDDQEAGSVKSEDDCPPPYQSSPNGTGILVTARSRSSSRSSNRSQSSTRRKTVRFNLEEESRRQSEHGADVQYIAAPGGDGYAYTYGSQSGDICKETAVGYGVTHGNGQWAPNGTPKAWYTSTNNVKTPWQWQGRFEDFEFGVEQSQGVAPVEIASRTPEASPSFIIARKPLPAGSVTDHTKEQALQDQMISQGVLEGVKVRGGSFDFGLSTVRPIVRVVTPEPAEYYNKHESVAVIIAEVTPDSAVDHKQHQLAFISEKKALQLASASKTSPVVRQSAFSDTTVSTSAPAYTPHPSTIILETVIEQPEPNAVQAVLPTLPATTYTPHRRAPSPPIQAHQIHPLTSHPPHLPASVAPALSFTFIPAPQVEASSAAMSETSSEPDTTSARSQGRGRASSRFQHQRSKSADDVNADTRDIDSSSDTSSVVTLSAILSDYGARSSRLGPIAEEL